MHIAYVIPTIDRIGGAERQLILLATGMAQRGWGVTVIALSGTGGSALTELSSHGVSFLSLEMHKGLADPRGWIRLHCWLRSQRPDLVHAHLPHATLLARWSRLVAPVRVLIDTIHSPATGGQSRRFGYRISSRLPDIVTAVSASAATPWLNASMVRSYELAVIPNGIDMNHWKRSDEIRQEARRQSGFTNEFVWLSVGRLDPVKDHTTLLRAFANLPGYSRLLLAGTGPLEPALRRLSSELGIAKQVTFLGFQSDILPWMQRADAFVLSSRWEGLPVALLEACACELPAVITDTPGAREVLPHPRINAVPVGNSDAPASAMNTVMSMPEAERRELGIRARRTVSARFSLDAVLDRYEKLYRDALAINLRPARWRTSSVLMSGFCDSSATAGKLITPAPLSKNSDVEERSPAFPRG